MKISKLIIASLVLASLNTLAQEKPKEKDKSKTKTTTKKPDERTAKKDSIKKAEPKPEKWNCPPCGMG